MGAQPIALAGIGVAGGWDTAGFRAALLTGTARPNHITSAPPRSLVVNAARDAVSAISLPGTGIMVFGAMAEPLAAEFGVAAPAPVIPAGDETGTAAVTSALRALRTRQAAAAMVAATDGTTAVVLVFEAWAGRRDSATVLAIVEETSERPPDLVWPADCDPATWFGVAPPARGSLTAAAAAIALRHRALPRQSAPADPALSVRTAEIVLGGVAPLRLRLRAGAPAAWVAERPPRLRVFSGRDRHSVLGALDRGQESAAGPARLVVLAEDDAELARQGAAARGWLTNGGPKPDGVAFRPRPLNGGVAWVFTGGMVAYPGMGRELLLAFPELVDEFEQRPGLLGEIAGWAYARPAAEPDHVLQQIWATSLLSAVHARVVGDVLGARPEAVLGYSAGEYNGLAALGAWTDHAELIERLGASALFRSGLAGSFDAIKRAWAEAGVSGARWENHLVSASAREVGTALAGEPAVHLIGINAPKSCVIGGEAAGCRRVLARLRPARAVPLGYDIAMHTPELRYLRDECWKLHHRPVSPVPGVRFYTCATADWYTPTADTVAEALTRQAMETIDFAGTVEKAWADGVRIFIEHGPRSLCTQWIGETLAGRDHLAIAMDGGIRQIAKVAAELVAAGVPIDTAGLYHRLAGARHGPATPRGAVAAVQRAFVLRQAEVHQRFLRVCQDVRVVLRRPARPGVSTARAELRVEAGNHDVAGHLPAGETFGGGRIAAALSERSATGGGRKLRLLGCELTFLAGLPARGKTLRYDIRITRRHRGNGQSSCALEYDGSVHREPGLSVRRGEAALLTDAELARLPALSWIPEPSVDEPVDPPPVAVRPRSFDTGALRAFAEGRFVDCFGSEWARTSTQVRAPRIAAPDRISLSEVSTIDPQGGPWRRGYLSADALPDALDDVTDLFEGCLQAMAFYLTALGSTLELDGWRFEPVVGRTMSLRFRPPVSTAADRLCYEVFVRGFSAGPEPTLYADVLGHAGGTKVVHVHRAALRLVPAWPLDEWRHLCPPAIQATGDRVPPAALAGLAGHRERKAVAESDGSRFGYESLLAGAWGRPSEAYGPLFAELDTSKRVARLPAPPYHFISRVVSVDGPAGAMRIGSRVVTEYDIPDKAWYFEQNSREVMPFAVFGEAAGQPCIWLANYVGCPFLSSAPDLRFRNLDGSGVIFREITPQTDTVSSVVRLRDVSESGESVIVSFDLEFYADGLIAMTGSTVFGYFPPSAFVAQPGLSDGDAWPDESGGPIVDLRADPPVGAGDLRLAGPMLLMLDRVTGYWPHAGRAGLGRLRAEKDVDPTHWVFAAHFFGDPVQPGSLGIQGMIQLLEYYLIRQGAGRRWANPRFQQMTGRRMGWKYRGQVLPENKLVTVEIQIVERSENYAVAEGWLYVDGARYYHVTNLGVEVVG